MHETDTRPFAAPAVEDVCRTRPQTRRVERVETTPVSLEGELTLEPTALPKLLRVLDGRPRLARLARPANGVLRFDAAPFCVSAAEWEGLYKGILLCAGLAFEGEIVITGQGGWETRVPASGDPPTPRRRITLTMRSIFGWRRRMAGRQEGAAGDATDEIVAPEGPED